MNERERWLIQVEEKMKRGNQILFDRNSVLLQPLIDLLCVQNRRAVVLWCLDGMAHRSDRNARRGSGASVPAVGGGRNPHASGKEGDPGCSCDREGER